jgi:hypothetical protein
MKPLKSGKLLLTVITLGSVLLFGGCGVLPPEAVLSGTWKLTTDEASTLPDTFLIFNSNGVLTTIQFVVGGATISQTIQTGSTTVSGTNVTISQGFGGTSSINFIGTLNTTNTVATGTLQTIINLGTITITLPATPATMTKQ